MSFAMHRTRSMSQSHPTDIPSANPTEQTMMWQQGSFVADSGMHSGASSYAPSVCGEDNENKVLFDWDQPGFSQEQVEVSHGNYNCPPNIPTVNQNGQTVMWLDASNMIDSGIHSGTTTHVPSVCGREDDNKNVEMLFDQSGYNQAEVVEMSQDQCSQVAERDSKSLSGVMGIPCARVGAYMTAASQPIGDSSPMLNHGVVDLPPQEDDANRALRAIPNLVKLLADEDQFVISKAIPVVYGLSKKEASMHLIINEPYMVAGVVHCLSTSKDFETIKCAAGTLHQISFDKQGSMAILNCNGIPALIKLLSSPIESIFFYAITILHNLLLHQDSSKMAIRRVGGLQKMLPLLRHNNVKFLAILTDCLQILTNRHQESKLIVLASGGTSELIRIMQSYTYEKLLWTTSRALKALSFCPSNKSVIIDVGGMQALGMHLGHQSQRLVVNCLETLKILSNAATKQDGIDDLLHKVVQLLGSSNANIVLHAACILSNLTCHNQHNKLVIYHVQGIESLLRAIVQAGDREEITEPAVCALRHLTSGHAQSEMAQNLVRLHFGLQAIVKLLNPLSSWALIKAVIGLIKNLSLCTFNHSPLREYGVIQRLSQLLFKAYQEIQRCYHNDSSMGTLEACVDGVKMEEIVEGVVCIFQRLAPQVQNRTVIRNLDVIPIIVQLLQHETGNVQHVATGVLCELAADREGSEMIEAAGATGPLTILMHSKNKHVARNAATVLFQISENKAKSQKRLSLDLANHLLREDADTWAEMPVIDMDLNVLGPEEGYHDQMYQWDQGPPSVCQANNRHNVCAQQGYEVQASDAFVQALTGCNEFDGSANVYSMDNNMDLDRPPDTCFDNFESMLPPTPEDGDISQHVASWYDTNL